MLEIKTFSEMFCLSEKYHFENLQPKWKGNSQTLPHSDSLTPHHQRLTLTDIPLPLTCADSPWHSTLTSQPQWHHGAWESAPSRYILSTVHGNSLSPGSSHTLFHSHPHPPTLSISQNLNCGATEFTEPWSHALPPGAQTHPAILLCHHSGTWEFVHMLQCT